MCLRQLAEYRDLAADFHEAGFDLVALSVDEPLRTEAVRQELRLPFPILCDTRRKVVEAWGVFNRGEKGGIARPATFVLGRDLRVLLASLDGEFNRVDTASLRETLRSQNAFAGRAPTPRRFFWPSAGDWRRAIRNAFRFGLRSPR